MALTKVTQHSLGNSAVTTAKLNLAAPLGFANSSANVLYMAANGNVGIGTSAPSTLMQVSKTNAGGDVGLFVSQGSTGYTNASSTVTLYLGATYDSIAQASKIVASHSDGTSGDHGQNLQLWTVNSGSTPTERMRITSAGYVGIGTTSPETKVQVEGTADTVGATLRITSTGVCSAGMAVNATGLFFAADTGGFVWKTGAQNLPTTSGTERMRLDSSGNFIIGKTSVSTINGGGGGSAFWNSGTNNIWRLQIGTSSTGSSQLAGWNTPNGEVGNITVSGVSTSYGTSSDYRLKENITPIIGALSKVAQLKPVTYKWKVDGSDGEGFIAHELSEVCPLAVTGEKDGVDEENKPKYQSIDTSFLVATLTAAIQELKAEFDAYRASHP